MCLNTWVYLEANTTDTTRHVQLNVYPRSRPSITIIKLTISRKCAKRLVLDMQSVKFIQRKRTFKIRGSLFVPKAYATLSAYRKWRIINRTAREFAGECTGPSFVCLFTRTFPTASGLQQTTFGETFDYNIGEFFIFFYSFSSSSLFFFFFFFLFFFSFFFFFFPSFSSSFSSFFFLFLFFLFFFFFPFFFFFFFFFFWFFFYFFLLFLLFLLLLLYSSSFSSSSSFFSSFLLIFLLLFSSLSFFFPSSSFSSSSFSSFSSSFSFSPPPPLSSSFLLLLLLLLVLQPSVNLSLFQNCPPLFAVCYLRLQFLTSMFLRSSSTDSSQLNRDHIVRRMPSRLTKKSKLWGTGSFNICKVLFVNITRHLQNTEIITNTFFFESVS